MREGNEGLDDAVRATLRLARIHLSGPEARALSTQLARILDAFRTLQQVDVGSVEPVSAGSAAAPPAPPPTAALRPDRPRPGLDGGELLARAPERDGDFFRVPRTVGGEP